MLVEITAAVNFIVGHLYNKLPRRRVDALSEELIKCFLVKFEGHWYPDNPALDSAFRCTRVTGEIGFFIDLIFRTATKASGLTVMEVLDLLPKGLVINIDPGEVTYRIGEKGQLIVLYFGNSSSGFSGATAVDNWLSTGFQRNVTSTMTNDYGEEATGSTPSFDMSTFLANVNLSQQLTNSRSVNSSALSHDLIGSKSQHASPLVNFSYPPPPLTSPAAMFIPIIPCSKHMYPATNFAQTRFGTTKLKSEYTSNYQQQQQSHFASTSRHSPVDKVRPRWSATACRGKQNNEFFETDHVRYQDNDNNDINGTSIWNKH